MDTNECTLDEALEKVRCIFKHNREYLTDNFGHTYGDRFLLHPRIADALVVLTNVCIEQNKRIKALKDKLEIQNAG